MKWVYQNLNSEIYKSAEKFKHIEFLFFGFLSFCIPFLLGHPQLLVGTLVNAFIISASLNLDAKRILPLTILPSIGVLFRGILFGPLTLSLVFMLPFIWIGNMILVLALKHLLSRKMNYAISVAAGAGAKALFLFSITYILFQFEVLPSLFLTAMGAVQLATALMGGIVAYLLLKISLKAGMVKVLSG